MALSKNCMKYIRSFELKKNRKAERLFLAEGPKLVGDLVGHFPCRLLVATAQWLAQHKQVDAAQIVEATDDELSRASLLKTPQQVLALFEQPAEDVDTTFPQRELCLALDDVQDPGNLGTIIRLADWFGIRHIYCSPNTADAFSPKVIQATMGAIARVNVHYIPLPDLIQSLGDTPIYGTFLDGDSIYKQSLSENGLIVMGNEGNGISQPVAALINRKLLIPNYPEGCATSESLNVAIATAVVCAEFRRTASLK